MRRRCLLLRFGGTPAPSEQDRGKQQPDRAHRLVRRRRDERRAGSGRRGLGEEDRQHRQGDRRARTSTSSSARRSRAATRRTSSTSAPSCSPTTPRAARSTRTGTSCPAQDDFSSRCDGLHLRREVRLRCPRTSSTLALGDQHRAMWKKAGLTAADYPKTWDDLEKVAKKLTDRRGHRPVVDRRVQRLGAFMKQSGGWITTPTRRGHRRLRPRTSSALTFVKKLPRRAAR